jgi:hypothetical protein
MMEVTMLRYTKLAIASLTCASALALQTPANATLVLHDISGDNVADAIYDTSANVTWLRQANLAVNFPGALAWANAQTLGGLSWRLPSPVEMQSLILASPIDGFGSHSSGMASLFLDIYNVNWTNQTLTLGSTFLALEVTTDFANSFYQFAVNPPSNTGALAVVSGNFGSEINTGNGKDLPEPASLPLMAFGVLILTGIRMRQKWM